MIQVAPRQRGRSQSEPLNQTEANSFPSGRITLASRSDLDKISNGMRFLDTPSYDHVSEFKSSDMTITLKSPSIRVLRTEGEIYRSFPLYGDNDCVMGSVSLDSQNCPGDSGQLSIFIEGAFEYISPMSATKAGPSQITPGKHRHVFYSDSAVIPLYAVSEPARGPFRSAFTSRLRRTTSKERARTLSKSGSLEFMRNNRSLMSITPALPKVFNFNFPFPKSDADNDELPSTFSCSNVVSGGVRGRVYAENADVRYRVYAVWETLDASGNQARLDAPILFQSDTEFQSLDGLSGEHDSWTERPLSKVEGLPIECFITIPKPATFSRASLVPYYVVFNTDRSSRSLTAEMMADATIAVSLVRCVAFDKQRPKPALTIQTDIKDPSSRSESPRSLSSSKSVPSFSQFKFRGKDKDQTSPRLFKRVVKSAPPSFWASQAAGFDSDANLRADPWNQKPLPPTPEEQNTDNNIPKSDENVTRDSFRLSDSRTLYTDISVGFPKRPKGKTKSPNSHPTLAAHKALPEGLYKSTIPLQKNWFPSLRWKGLQIEYYLQVSVIFDSNEFKGRVPLRIY